MTGAEYFNVGSAEQLHTVYESLGSKLVAERRKAETTGALALVADLIGLSMARFIVWPWVMSTCSEVHEVNRRVCRAHSTIQ
jgi:hypothetical protein